MTGAGECGEASFWGSPLGVFLAVGGAILGFLGYLALAVYLTSIGSVAGLVLLALVAGVIVFGEVWLLGWMAIYGIKRLVRKQRQWTAMHRSKGRASNEEGSD